MTALRLPGRYYRLYPTIDAPLGHAEEELELGLDDTALLIVDVYGAGFDDEVPEGLEGVYAVDPHTRDIVRNRIRPVKDAARAIGLPTIYLTNYRSPGIDEGNVWRNLSLRVTKVDVLTDWKAPTPILEHSKVIAPDEEDVLIRKQYYSGFHETELDSALRNRGIRNLVVVGFDSRLCLGTTVVDALYRNYRVVVLRDCVSTFEFPETREGGWANFIAIRQIECNVGYTSAADDFRAACAAVGTV